MSKKDEFKLFVSKHPKLIKYVENNEATWQKFFEIYSLYGESDDAWNKYLNLDNNSDIKNDVSISDLISMVKKVDLDTIQKNITNISKAIGLVQSLITKEEPNINDTYIPRPLYKKFED